VAVSPDANGGSFFTTGKGRLYHEQPSASGVFSLTDMGWMHPAGPRYPAVMFRNEHTRTLYAVTMPSHNGGTAFDWVTRQPTGETTVARFPFGDSPEFPTPALVYGSITHDGQGRFYVVGSMAFKPLVLQVTASN
jgi:hypothetical protein